MRKYKWILIIIAMLFSTNLVLAMEMHYFAMIDAGSSGSRIYVFQTSQIDKTAVPYILLLGTKAIRPGISAYESKPEAAAESIKVLLDYANHVLSYHNKNQHTKNDFNLFATAGMRKLSEQQQQQIYDAIKTMIAKNYPAITVGEVKTIAGDHEGLFDWLAVNYLSDVFRKNERTLGALDLGGASTQIAFEVTKSNSKNTNEYHLSIGEKTYNVFSYSFLGMGVNEIKKQIVNPSCYPSGYNLDEKIKGHFDFNTCKQSIIKYLDTRHAFHVIPAIPAEMNFVGVSNYYFINDYFGSADMPLPVVLTHRVKQECSNEWMDLEDNHANTKPEYVASACLTGTYIVTLLENVFNFKQDSSLLKVANAINDTRFSWTYGAVLYLLANQAK